MKFGRLADLILVLLFFIPAAAFGIVDFYEVLGAERNASPAAIDRAYAAQVEASPAGVSSVVRNAYQTLSDPAKRRVYDQSLTEFETQQNAPLIKAEHKVDLKVIYRLSDPTDTNLKTSLITLLRREKPRAVDRVIRKIGIGKTPAQREIVFHREYEKNDLKYGVVLELAIENAPAFFAADPSPKEVAEFMDALDLMDKVVVAAFETKWAHNTPSPTDIKIEQVKAAGYAYLLNHPDLLSEDQFIAAFQNWLGRSASDPAPINRRAVKAWLNRYALTYGKTATDFWNALQKARRGMPSPRLAAALIGSVPGELLVDAIVDTVLIDSVRKTRRSFTERMQVYVTVLDQLVGVDEKARAQIESFGGVKTFVGSLFSPAARCRWALYRTMRGKLDPMPVPVPDLLLEEDDSRNAMGPWHHEWK